MAATQEKLYNELSTDVINNDDNSAAKELYEKYEKLPLVEQLALGFTPVVGETISAYETPIFARETKEAFQEGDYLKTLGKGALTGLAAIGSLPLIGMGARGLKGAAKVLGKRLSKDAPIDKTIPTNVSIKEPFAAKPYSRLTKAVNNLEQKRGTGAAYTSRLQNVSPDEFTSSGLRGFLNDRRNTKLSKEELKKYIDINELPIEKIDLNISRETVEKIYNERKNIQSTIEDLHFKEYKGDMDSLYYETVLKTDSKELANLKNKSRELKREFVKKGNSMVKFPQFTILGKYNEQGIPTKGNEKNYKEINFKVPGKEYYQEHYSDTRNIIGRVRTADRTDLDGKSTKHIEELQSEYARDRIGKKPINKLEYKSYLDRMTNLNREKAPYLAEMKKIETQQNKIFEIESLGGHRGADEMRPPGQPALTEIEIDTLNKQDDFLLDKLEKRQKEIQKIIGPLEQEAFMLMRKYNKTIPELPYTKGGNEYKYPLRRMLLEAAQEGKESLTLTAGQVQFNRYAPSNLYEFELSKLKDKKYVKENLKQIIDDIKKLRESYVKSIEGKYKPVTKGSLEEKLKNIKLNKAARKYQSEYQTIMLKHKLQKNQLNKLRELESNLDRKNIDKISSYNIDEMFRIDPAIYVAEKYDNQYKEYLKKLAKKYNTTLDKTRVDSNLVNNIQEYGKYKGKVKGDKAEAYRLIITPEMRTKLLTEGIEKLKEGGIVMKDYYKNYNTQRAI